MRHHEIAGAMPGLRYNTSTALSDISSMVDELAATPPGHERAGVLSQQIKSKLDGVSTAITEVQPDQVEPGPVVGETVRGDGQTAEQPYEMHPVLAERFSDLEARVAAMEHGPTDVHDHVYEPQAGDDDHSGGETEKPAETGKGKKGD